MEERHFECVKYECEKIQTIYFWIVCGIGIVQS